MLRIDFDDSSFKLGMKALADRIEPSKMMIDLSLVAMELLGLSIRSPIPRDEGALAASAAVVKHAAKGEVVFGFNRVYAKFQDQPGKVGYVTIVPRHKKILYIPMTRAGKRHRYGANPRLEGLIRGIDYVLKEKVTIRIKSYRNPIGPNHYFSETLRRQQNRVFTGLAKLIAKRIGF